MELTAGLVLFVIYFLPAGIASGRKHPNSTSILVLNFFLGWTFIGWVIALVWAYSRPVAVAQKIED